MKNLLYVLAIIFVPFCMTSCGKSNGKADKESKEKTVLTEDTIQRPKPNINVYIENSKSIDGYFNGDSEFKNILYNYLSDILNSEITDTLKLNYISKVISPLKTSKNQSDLERIREYTQNCDNGGDRSSSDFVDIFQQVLERTGTNDVSILVTDGIFSPEQRGDAEFNQKMQYIRDDMRNHLKVIPETAVVLYMMESEFDGTYFYEGPEYRNKSKNKEAIKGPRPFYIWVFGHVKDIANLKEKVSEPNFRDNKVIKKFEISKPSVDLNYCIKPVDKKDHNPKYEKEETEENIVYVKKIDSGYRFVALVDYRDYEQMFGFGEEFLSNTNNYKTDDTTFSIVKVKKIQSQKGYSHELTFELTKNFFSKGDTEKKLRVWFNEQNDDWSDVNDDEGGSPIPGKTYTIKYQVESICEAYSTKEGKCAEMTFTVKKGQ